MAGNMLHPQVKAPFAKFASRTNWRPPLHGLTVAGLTFPFGKAPYEALLKVLGNEDPTITGEDDAGRMLSAIAQQDLITNRGWNILDMACALADRYPSAQVPPDKLDEILKEAKNKTDAGQLAADVSLTILLAKQRGRRQPRRSWANSSPRSLPACSAHCTRPSRMRCPHTTCSRQPATTPSTPAAWPT